MIRTRFTVEPLWIGQTTVQMENHMTFLKSILCSFQGRYLVATKDILAGDLIGIEEGLSTLLYPEKMNNTISHCQHCFKFTKCPLPCEVRFLLSLHGYKSIWRESITRSKNKRRFFKNIKVEFIIKIKIKIEHLSLKM